MKDVEGKKGKGEMIMVIYDFKKLKIINFKKHVT